TTFADALAVLRSHGLSARVPTRVSRFLQDGARGLHPETLKRSSKSRARVIASADRSLAQAARLARQSGYHVLNLGSRVEGEAREVAQAQMREAELLSRRHGRVCLISGGETTVRVRGRGQGGRNQEFVLAALLAGRAKGRFLVLSAGTDGRDGTTRAAGAWGDEHTLERARKLGLSARGHLARNDSHRFFSRLGGLVVTGPTGTNVMDFRAILIDPA
ncbi:MAG TPA: MOFRL family protein, partial [Bdellovibrionota bacterium]|nr:MOFRL family protein [Bdellovibrionota bacterium]